MGGLERRAGCPSCRSTRSRQVFPGRDRPPLPYDQPPVRDHLQRFYGARADLDAVSDGSFAVLRCRSCGLRYQSEVPGPELSEALYDTWIDPEASQADKAASEAHLTGPHRALLCALAELAGCPTEGATLVDLGMGWGALARAAQGLGFTVVGIELSVERRDAAVGSEIEVVTPADVEAGALDGRADVVVANQVLEHLVEPRQAARDIRRMLRPGGAGHAEVPNGSSRRMVPVLWRGDWSAPKFSRWSLNPVAPLEHVNCWTRPALRRLLVDAGLRPIGIRHQAQVHLGLDWRTRLLGYGALAMTACKAG